MVKANPPALQTKPPGLALKYLPANDAWIWMFRSTWLTLKGEGRFFQTRKEARAAARRLGMKV